MSNYDKLCKALYEAELHRRQAKVDVVKLLLDMKVKWSYDK